MTGAAMGEILFLAHRMPFPPDRGDKIRSCHMLRRISALAPVHVACFADDEADWSHEPELAAISASLCLVARTKSVPVAAAQALATGKPVSLTAFSSPAIRRFVRETLATRPISAIFVFSGQMAQYIPEDFTGPVVMDFVDVDSAKFEAYARAGNPAVRVMYRREANLLRRFEEKIAHRATVSVLVTDEEATLFRDRLQHRRGTRVMALPNGIDWRFYDPSGIVPAPDMLRAGPQIVFTGQMDYPPNVAAVEFFARQVMPRVRERFAQAEFNVVGRAPVAEVQALHGRNGCRVTGTVPDVRPWLAGADLVVAPLLIARGVQNKVLEAMAMARPVLATRAAATGIPARVGQDLAVADGPEDFATHTMTLLADTALARSMGAAGRRFVVDRCGWDRALDPLPALLGADRRGDRHAA